MMATSLIIFVGILGLFDGVSGDDFHADEFDALERLAVFALRIGADRRLRDFFPGRHRP